MRSGKVIILRLSVFTHLCFQNRGVQPPRLAGLGMSSSQARNLEKLFEA